MPHSNDTGQTWLPGVSPVAEFRTVDLCIEHFCRKFLATFPQDSGPPLPADLDDLALACLLLAHEHGPRSPKRITLALSSCLSAVRTRFWGDQLPWRLALDICLDNPDQQTGLNQLIANLDHGNSSIRLWMMEIAWLVRERLDPDEAVHKLLNNVANTLGSWDAAVGLCAAIHREEGYFWISAEGHEPEDYTEQYLERLAFTRDRGVHAFSARFEHRELRLRRRIESLSLIQPARED